MTTQHLRYWKSRCHFNKQTLYCNLHTSVQFRYQVNFLNKFLTLISMQDIHCNIQVNKRNNKKKKQFWLFRNRFNGKQVRWGTSYEPVLGDPMLSLVCTSMCVLRIGQFNGFKIGYSRLHGKYFLCCVYCSRMKHIAFISRNMRAKLAHGHNKKNSFGICEASGNKHANCVTILQEKLVVNFQIGLLLWMYMRVCSMYVYLCMYVCMFSF